jgi:hypothetical protein
VIVDAIDVEVDIADAESRRYGLWLWKGGEDDDEGEQERVSGEEGAEWYGSWPSEKEDAGVWKEVKPVCAELRGAGAPLRCALMVQGEEVDRGRARRDCEGGH